MAVTVILMRQARVVVFRVAHDVAIRRRVDLDAGLGKFCEATLRKARPCIATRQRPLGKHALFRPVVEHRAIEEDARRANRQAADIAARRLGRPPCRHAEAAAARDETLDGCAVPLRDAPAARNQRPVEIAQKNGMCKRLVHAFSSPAVAHQARGDTCKYFLKTWLKFLYSPKPVASATS